MKFSTGGGLISGAECSVRNSLKVQSMKVLRLPSVCELTGVPRSTLYLYIKNNQFPKPVKLGIKSVGWIQEEVEQWLLQRMEQRDAI
jgi:prophage regulatory protein